MATPNPAKRDEAPAPNPPRHDEHAPDAYCAQVVSLSALRHFVHVNGGGQKAVAWLAGRQLSVVRTPQLYAAGLDRGAIGHRRRQRAGINVYRVEQLDRRDRGAMHGIAVTAPARTLADFAADAEDDELEAALSESRALKLITERDVVAALDRAGNRKGVARLRRLLRLENDSGYTSLPPDTR